MQLSRKVVDTILESGLKHVDPVAFICLLDKNRCELPATRFPNGGQITWSYLDIRQAVYYAGLDAQGELLVYYDMPSQFAGDHITIDLSRLQFDT